MWNNLRHWLNDIPIHDPIERRQAPLVQGMLIGLLATALLALPLALMTLGPSVSQWLGVTSDLLGILFTASALVLLRRGRFNLSILMATIGMLLALALSVIPAGPRTSASILIAFALPITLVGLLSSRRNLLLTIGLSIAIVIIASIIERFAPLLVSVPTSQSAALVNIISTFILIVGLIGLFLDRFSRSLRNALTDSLAREEELEQLRASLETNVAERTASLQQALQEGEQRQARLAQALDDLRISQTTIHELSAPVIPVLPGVLIAPLIGALDSARAATLADNILGMVERTHADRVIFDITGVPVVDSHVAKVLLEAATAARLLGAQTLLVGIRPEVAQTIITLGIDFAALATYPSLQEAVAAILTARADNGLNSAERAW